jgi:hypothetical protein
MLPERKMKHLFEQPLHLLTHGAVGGEMNSAVTHEDVRRLVYWHVEDTLKTAYARCAPHHSNPYQTTQTHTKPIPNPYHSNPYQTQLHLIQQLAFRFVETLAEGAKDSLEHLKDKSMKACKVRDKITVRVMNQIK